jgi:hypothetical protein
MSALDTTPTGPSTPWRKLVLAHAWLAVSMSVWRIVEGMPRTSSVTGGTFAASPAGRALALVTVLGGVVALIVVAVSTYRLRRDWRALALFVALGSAVWSRTRFDVFDITYVAVTAIAVALVLLRVPHAAATTAHDPT